MALLKVLLITIILVFIIMLGLSVRLLFKPEGEFRSGSCNNIPDELKDKDFGCGCGTNYGCNAE